MAVKGIESWGFKLCPTKDKEIFDYESIESPKNKMRSYLIFPGVYVVYIDFKEKYSSENSIESSNYGYRIAYSYEGNYFTYINNSKVLINRQLFVGKYIPKSKKSYTNREKTTAFNIVINPNNLDISKDYYKILQTFVNKFKNISDVGYTSSDKDLLEAANQLILYLKEENKSLIAIKTLELICLISDRKISDNRSRYYKKQGEDQIFEIESYLRKNLANDISLDFLVDKFKISKSSLNNKFISEFQYTPMRYLNIIRMMKAQELLINTNKEIGQIAEDLGFAEQSNFTRNFKIYSGLCPSKYRKIYKNVLIKKENVYDK